MRNQQIYFHTIILKKDKPPKFFMDLRELIVVREKRDTKSGRKYYERLDNHRIFLGEDIELIKEEPVIIVHAPNTSLEPIMKMNHLDKTVEANALLLGEKQSDGRGDYYPVSYCRIK